MAQLNDSKSEAERIAEYNRLTQEEFRNRVLSPEFAAAVDAAIPGGPVPIVREAGERMDEAAQSDGVEVQGKAKS